MVLRYLLNECIPEKMSDSDLERSAIRKQILALLTFFDWSTERVNPKSFSDFARDWHAAITVRG